MRFCPNLHTVGGLLFGDLELGDLHTILKHPMEAVERLENVTSFSFVDMKGTRSESTSSIGTHLTGAKRRRC